MPGVHAVLTHEDVPGEKRYGLEFPDQPVLAFDRVRYFGEPVALVAAEHPEQARRAAEAVRVEYEPLEPVIDPERATEQRADPPRPPDAGPRLPRRPAAQRRPLDRHPPRRPGRRRATSPSRASYELGIQDQAFLGPESGLAVPDGEGGVDIYVATQWLHVDRDQVAPCLGLDAEQVRIHLAGVGGAFGGREDLSMQIHGAHARPAHEPARSSSSTTARSRSSATSTATRRGSGWSTARTATASSSPCAREILLDGGAYASSSTAVTSNAASFACGPYAVANALHRGRVRVHEQPAVRRDAGLRRGADLLRARGADGQARGRARASTRSSFGCGTRSVRATCSRRPDGHRLAAGRRGDPARCARSRCRSPRSCRATRSASRAARGTRRAARASSAASASRSASRTSATRRASTTPARRASASAPARTGSWRRGALRGRRGRPGRDERHPPGRAHRARHRERRRSRRTRPRRRLGRLGLGLAA